VSSPSLCIKCSPGEDANAIAERDGTSRAEGSSNVEHVVSGGRETWGVPALEMTLPAFLLVRESGFFRAALTTGLEETHSRVVHYKAADAKGEP
jgi:hypothetical protein